MSNPLQTWLDDEGALRQTLAAHPSAAALTPAQALSRSGLELMQAMLAGEVHSAIGHTLDFLLVEVSHGRAVFQGTPGPAHLNPMGTVHGGWYAALLDSALGCCVHSTLPAGKAYTTLELKVNMIRSIRPDTQRVRAIGQVIHVGGQTATADARLVGPDGKLYAHGSTTCLVFDARGVAKV